MDILSAFGLSASAGLNAYIPLLIVSLLARFTDLIELSEPWSAMESWWIIGILLLLSLVEFFADKIPAVNHINDAIQTFIRPAAGAVLFAASANVITDIHPILSLAAGLLVAGSVHAVKAAAQGYLYCLRDNIAEDDQWFRWLRQLALIDLTEGYKH